MTNFDKDLIIEWGKALASAVVALLMVFMMLAICGCSTTKYVPVESTTLRTDTLYKAVWHTDSIIDRDTILLTEQGKEIIRWRIRTREVHDTIYQSLTDSVRVEVPYPVERELTKWESAKMELGGVAFGAVLVLLGVAGWLAIRKRRK